MASPDDLFAVWCAIPEPEHRYRSLHYLDDAVVVEYI